MCSEGYTTRQFLVRDLGGATHSLGFIAYHHNITHLKGERGRKGINCKNEGNLPLSKNTVQLQELYPCQPLMSPLGFKLF